MEYIKLNWPEYQGYEDLDEAYYCPEHDCYFVPDKEYQLRRKQVEDWLNYKKVNNLILENYGNQEM